MQEELGTFQFSFTFIFQILNTVIIIGLIYFAIKITRYLLKRNKEKVQQLNKIEETLDKINEKIHND